MINKLYLAPMAGVTDRTFRLICKNFGVDYLTTEMVSAKGLYYKSKKTASLMTLSKEEHPISIQFFGSDPEIMAEVAPILVNYGADAIDINMGCPMPKIVNNGDGSALMKNPDLAGKIVKAIKYAVNIPVTVKIRKGYEENNAAEFAKVLEANGADLIAVHGRTKDQLYSGLADLSVIKEVKSSVKIPVIGNGDIFSAEDAKHMLDATGCDGVMVGRGALGNPFIFKQIKEYLKTGNVTYFPTNRERIETAIMHAKMLCEDKSEHTGILEARKHIAWYIKGLPHANELKNKVFLSNSFEEMKTLLEAYLN